LKRVARELRNNKFEYAGFITLEMGKPIRDAEAEIEKCALGCDYYAENAEKFLQEELKSTEASTSKVCYEPLGVILAVMPWNFPFWQVFRFAAPTLMAGNVGILKHASNVPQCSLAIETVFTRAGLPEGVFQSLLVGSSAVESLIAHPVIQAVTLTGSSAAGQKVASAAGHHLKKSVLELGGSDPFIVLEDADLEKAAQGAVQGRFVNGGQSCIAAKRFIVLESVADAFEALVEEKIEKIIQGDPMDTKTQMGPMARRDLREELHRQVEASISQGAVLRAGGKIPEGSGAFYPPTLLTNVRKGMPVYDEETFGPVLPVIRVTSLQEAIEVANDTPYGLGATLWTENTTRAEQLTAQIQAGSVFINSIVKSDPRLPFGGIKQSGYGRELSEWGIREFVNIKTVLIQ
jgi:succinate-semialdehyde dehydrogenase/glutarate-semialdehyde dehydrogenase